MPVPVLPDELLSAIAKACVEPYDLAVKPSRESADGLRQPMLTIVAFGGEKYFLTGKPDLYNLRLVNSLFRAEIRSAVRSKFSGKLACTASDFGAYHHEENVPLLLLHRISVSLRDLKTKIHTISMDLAVLGRDLTLPLSLLPNVRRIITHEWYGDTEECDVSERRLGTREEAVKIQTHIDEPYRSFIKEGGTFVVHYRYLQVPQSRIVKIDVAEWMPIWNEIIFSREHVSFRDESRTGESGSPHASVDQLPEQIDDTYEFEYAE